MLGLNAVTHRRTARGLFALMSAVWLLAAAAPCVMAAPHCPDMAGAPCETTDHTALPAASDCDTLQAVDCQRGDISLTDRIAVPDFPVLAPRLLIVAPVAAQPVRNALSADPERFALRLSPPPLYLQHAAFLI